MAARKNRGSKKGTMSEDWKNKIRAGMIADRFYKCFNGELELTPTQLKAGEALLRRLVPELVRTESDITHYGHIDYTQLPSIPQEQVHAIEGDVNGRYGALPPQLH